jgi:hypothetical protein
MENRGGYIPGCEARAERMGRANRKYPQHRQYWAYHLKADYGLSLADWDKLIIQSNGNCDICYKPFVDKKQSFNIDHNHSTKQVRGLLCTPCNTLLKAVEDRLFKTRAEQYLMLRDK